MMRWVAIGAIAAVAVALFLVVTGGQSPEERAGEVVESAAGSATGDDPFAWDPDRREEVEQRAATGTSEVIYLNSPGGVATTAKRTDAWRDDVERAARAHGIDPDRLEALVFLESAGRPEVIAGASPAAASGLTQITPSAATDFLDMEVDLDESKALTRKIARAERGDSKEARRLSAKRAAVDERFDPEKALDGAATYLEKAGARFGADDLATVSYHMGIGNLESVIRAYAGAEDREPIGDVLDATGELPYAQLYFDSAPDAHPEAYDLLSGFGDDSAEYYWKILASERIMDEWGHDRDRLARVTELATNKATLEEVYHPEEDTRVYTSPADVESVTGDGELLPLPDSSDLGWVTDAQMGELAPQLGAEPEVYRALRPEGLATLAYIGARVKDLSGAAQPLRVTSTVRDRAYQDVLRASNPEATDAYSLHTTGFSFDVLRDYESDHQAAAFQFALDRLQALAVIDYAVEPRAIHVTVSSLGAELLPP
jgi:SAM-dependent methyltransferase